jgi:hypothetical protein
MAHAGGVSIVKSGASGKRPWGRDDVQGGLSRCFQLQLIHQRPKPPSRNDYSCFRAYLAWLFLCCWYLVEHKLTANTLSGSPLIGLQDAYMKDLLALASCSCLVPTTRTIECRGQDSRLLIIYGSITIITNGRGESGWATVTRCEA